jgi:hypothetical protein
MGVGIIMGGGEIMPDRRWGLLGYKEPVLRLHKAKVGIKSVSMDFESDTFLIIELKM